MECVCAEAKLAEVLDGGSVYLATLELHVFVNDYTPTPAMVITDFDEPTDGGYPMTPPIPTWAPAVIAAGKAVAVASETLYVWMHDAGTFNVEGAYLTDPNDGDVPVLAARRDTPFVVEAAGQVTIVRPRVTLGQIG